MGLRLGGLRLGLGSELELELGLELGLELELGLFVAALVRFRGLRLGPGGVDPVEDVTVAGEDAGAMGIWSWAFLCRVRGFIRGLGILEVFAHLLSCWTRAGISIARSLVLLLLVAAGQSFISSPIVGRLPFASRLGFISWWGRSLLLPHRALTSIRDLAILLSRLGRGIFELVIVVLGRHPVGVS